VRIGVAAVLAATADTVLVENHFLKLCAHLVTARPDEEIARKQEARGEKRRAGGGGGAVAASDKKFGSCAAEKWKYTTLCV
jgi:hypothetical protein